MDVFTPAERSRVMSRIRGRDTGPEVKVRQLLHRLGHRFRLQRRDLPGRPDLVLPARRAAVFVHGCFWHDHEGCRYATKPKSNAAFWAEKFARNRARDVAARAALEALGWTPLTVWECEVRDEAVLAARLDAAVRALERRPRRRRRVDS
jgi:DNA mismatch endonuclease (patch repair protein)